MSVTLFEGTLFTLRRAAGSWTTSTILRCSISSSPIRRVFSTSVSRDATWGFIGLGQMGYSMAKNLQAKIPTSDTLLIRDVNGETTEKFLMESKEKRIEVAGNVSEVVVAESPREVAEKSSVIITSLPGPAHVIDLFDDILESGKLPSLGQERLFIDTSTIDPRSSKQVASAVHGTRSGCFIDSPVSGGVVGAQAGTLTFMFGVSDSADTELMERIKSILLLMGKNTWHLGPQGSGVAGKLANNYILAVNNIAAAEAMHLGVRWGLDPKVLARMVSASTGRSWPMDVNNPVPEVIQTAPSSRGYEGGFGTSLMRKDLGLAITAAQESDTPLVLGDKTHQVYKAVEDEHPGKDFSVVYQWLQSKSE